MTSQKTGVLYTEDVLTRLHARGVKRPFVFSPGFVTDCLETLDELGNEGREQFVHDGGAEESFYLAPCLNDSPVWLDALAGLVSESGSFVKNRSQHPDLSMNPV